jgi:hypothetical protein
MVMSCASAAVDSANDAPNARPMSFSDFMRSPRGDYYGKCPAGAGFESRAYCRLILPRSHRQISGKSKHNGGRRGQRLDPSPPACMVAEGVCFSS